MKTFEIKITVTADGSTDNISAEYPIDVPIYRLFETLESCKNSIAHSGVEFLNRNHQLSEVEKQQIMQTITLRQIADDKNGH